MKKIKLIQSYSKAYYCLAEDKSCVKEVLQDCKNLLALLKKDTAILSLFDFKTSSIKNQKKVLQLLFSKTDFNKITKNFLSLLVENKRFFLIQDIADYMFVLKDKYDKVLNGSVTSVSKLSETEKKYLKDSLVDQFKSNINLQYKEDKSLAEGFIVRIAGHSLNTSFNNKMDNLNKHIKRNLSF
ncbi:MAG: ATP synthase F1 subunit delta [Bdellovibrionales bacterium]|nr:ATP synthase F1 subunit delta [Bdellovibrionales bacterium]